MRRDGTQSRQSKRGRNQRKKRRAQTKVMRRRKEKSCKNVRINCTVKAEQEKKEMLST